MTRAIVFCVSSRLTGHGLLRLRLTLGLPLICWRAADIAAAHTAIPSLAAHCRNIPRFWGLYARYRNTYVLVQERTAFDPAFAKAGETSMHLFLAAAAASVAMLGPGVCSVDARHFGRQVFEIGEPRRFRG